MNASINEKTSEGAWTEKALWWGILVFAGSIIFSIALVQTVVILLGVLLVVHSVGRRSAGFIRTPFDAAYLAFVLARILSIVFSIDPALSLEAFTKEIVFYVMFFVVTQGLPIRDKEKVTILFKLLFGTAVVAALYGTALFVFTDAERATSTVSGPVTLGMYLSAVLAIVLVLGDRKEFFSSRWIWFLVVGIITLGVVCTMNRVHWGIVLLMILVLGIARERKLLILALVGMMSAPFIPSVAGRIAASFQSFSQLMNGRDIIWMGSLGLLFERPIFGFGLRTFREIFPLFDVIEDKGIGSWHNDYLQVYMESGIIGLAAFLWLLGAILVYGIRAWKKMPAKSFEASITLALICSVAVFMLSGIVGGFVIDPLNSLLFRLLIAILGLLIVVTGNWTKHQRAIGGAQGG